jgi:methionyl aminopeptidase
MKGITIKTPEEIELLKVAGQHLKECLVLAEALSVPGASTEDINEAIEEKIRAYGDEPSFLGYTPEGVSRPYPAGLCISINDTVVHGIPNEDPQTLKEGDMVGLDCGLIHEGMFVDSARTVLVGEGDDEAKKLMKVTREALEAGIAAARSGNTTGDVGHAIESVIRPHGYGIVTDLSGHGVGYAVHEPPYVPNTGSPGEGEVLEAGMVIAIEPMVNEGKAAVKFLNDEYTVKTKDGSRSAHFEHTLVITDGAPIVVTR